LIVIPSHLARFVDRIAKGELRAWFCPPPSVIQR